MHEQNDGRFLTIQSKFGLKRPLGIRIFILQYAFSKLVYFVSKSGSFLEVKTSIQTISFLKMTHFVDTLNVI